MNSMKLFALGFLLIALSLGYYFVIYIPKRDAYKNDKEAANKIALQQCIQNANKTNVEFWNLTCNNLQLENGCQLPGEQATYVNKKLSNDKEDCYKQFPQ